MLDEVHERTMNTDIVLGLLRKVQRRRPDLRVIVSSATVEAQQFARFFETRASPLEGLALDASQADLRACATLIVEGRQHSIGTFYVEKPVPNYLQATVDTALKLHDADSARVPSGDVLAFLPGQAEVDWVVQRLQEEAARREDAGASEKRALSRFQYRVLPMYANLPFGEQIKVFQRPPRNIRKIVVATNIAEASITIPNIVFGDLNFILHYYYLYISIWLVIIVLICEFSFI